jgi:type I restriction enzyme S subunit
LFKGFVLAVEQVDFVIQRGQHLCYGFLFGEGWVRKNYLSNTAGEDWGEITIYDAIDLIGGGTPKTSIPEYWGGKIHWLSGGDITANHKGMVISSEKTITENGLANSSTKLLPKYSMVISARGTVGKYCMLSEPMTFSQSNYGVKPKSPNAYFFTYLLVAYSVDELQSAISIWVSMRSI